MIPEGKPPLIEGPGPYAPSVETNPLHELATSIVIMVNGRHRRAIEQSANPKTAFEEIVKDVEAAIMKHGQKREDEIERILVELPKTKDGVTVVRGMKVFYIHRKGRICETILIGNEVDSWTCYNQRGDSFHITTADCYSTRELAESAMRGGE